MYFQDTNHNLYSAKTSDRLLGSRCAEGGTGLLRALWAVVAVAVRQVLVSAPGLNLFMAWPAGPSGTVLWARVAIALRGTSSVGKIRAQIVDDDALQTDERRRRVEIARVDAQLDRRQRRQAVPFAQPA